MDQITRTSLKYVCYQTEYLDTTSEFLRIKLKKYNLPFLFSLYLRENNINKAMALFRNNYKRVYSVKVIRYIMKVYLDNSDFQGAWNYLKTYELTNTNSMAFENLVFAYEHHHNGNEEKCLEFIRKGLLFKFEAMYLDYVDNYDDIKDIIVNIKYLQKLNYLELKTMFDKFDENIYLEKMVEANPFIEEKYLLIGIERKIITKSMLSYILRHNCTSLLLSLGIKYGILEEAHRNSVEIYLKRFNKL